MNLWTIALASFAGSLHCAAMCGGFVALTQAKTSRDASQHPIALNLAYQCGRLVAYAGLGAVAGTFGFALEETSTFFGLRPLSGIILLLAVLGAGFFSLMPKKTLITLTRQGRAPDFLERVKLQILGARARIGDLPFSALVGLASALLPCAWLWAYVMVAASSGTPGAGAFTMAAFWLGSVPALSFAATLIRAFRRRLGRFAPRFVALLLIGLAAINLYERWPHGNRQTLEQPCHTP
jgi:sulfite exporter TauE/SafE